LDEYNLNCAAKSKLAKTLVLSHTNTEMSSRVKADTTEASSELKIVLKSSDMEQSKLEKTFQIAKEVSCVETEILGDRTLKRLFPGSSWRRILQHLLKKSWTKTLMYTGTALSERASVHT
jgi:hypothetical protein